MTTYTITQTRFSVNPDGTEGQINLVKWNASKTDGTVTGTIRNRGTVIPADYPPAMVEYQTLTPEDIVLWIIDLEDETGIEAQLDAAIAAIEFPQTSTGLPWQDSFPLWAIGVSVTVGYICTYQNVGYECIQAHTTQSTWAPPATPALWVYYVPPSEGPQPWVQPLGSEDSYPLGAQVTHNGNLWTSDIEANVFEPGVSSWTDEGVYP